MEVVRVVQPSCSRMTPILLSGGMARRVGSQGIGRIARFMRNQALLWQCEVNEWHAHRRRCRESVEVRRELKRTALVDRAAREASC